MGGTKVPIPKETIQETLAALFRFQKTCRDLAVSDSRVTVVATEATRNAINRDELLHEIQHRTGWTVRLLPKEEEGRLGCMGIASSVDELNGICIDMGGGSVQLTWASRSTNGTFEKGPSISLPYGAAALMSRLSSVSTPEQDCLHSEMLSELQNSFKKDLQIPAVAWDAARTHGGFDLYLSGGGLRGWGHILMSTESVKPYPIPIINGYSVTESQFYSGLTVDLDKSLTYRISKRRASQVPAVKAFVLALKQAQLPISSVTFAQGGVREGLLYLDLPASVRCQNPLVVSTLAFAPPSAPRILRLLRETVPHATKAALTIKPELLEATVNLLYNHGAISKDVRASSALRCTTTGILAGAHGLSHHDRQLLALIMCERWGGDVSDADTDFLVGIQTLSRPLSWWARYVGRAARVIAEVFPAGFVQESEQVIGIESHLAPAGGENLEELCKITIEVFSPHIDALTRAWAKSMEKLGKRKHWAPGENGVRVSVEVRSRASRG